MFDINSRTRHVTLGALLCVAAATVTSCAHSQQAPPADSASPQDARGGMHMRHRGGPRGDRMLQGLDLTKDQQAQVGAIRTRYRLKADSLRLGNAERDSTTRAQFRSMMTDEMGEIRAVLTPDQQKKFDDRMAKMRERRARHDGDSHQGHDGPPDGDSGGNPPSPSV